MNKKRLVTKCIFLAIVGLVLCIYVEHLQPMVTTDSAVKQLEDSDTAYLGFKATTKLPMILTLAYVAFSLGILYKEIKYVLTRLLKKGDK